LLAAGAAFVQVHSGLVYAGPGLPKRINDLVANAYPAPRGPAASLNPRLRAFYSWPNWVWIALLGAAMLFGGILAWLIAITRMVLPYDELFVGLSRADLATINARLLPFMAHDRVTLAGTMISIGVLYGQLALHGMRRGAGWAREAVLVSAVVGFASFFLFLGFGYFDPLHALVSVLLLPLFAFGMRQSSLAPAAAAAPSRHNDWRWRLGLQGQLLFVGIGFGLALAGCVIAGVGVTSVFVPEDLAFLKSTPGALGAITPRLIALVAHDRAGFGGALVSDGLALLLASLWGFQPGARWLWWTFVAAGVPGFVAAFGIHLAVGYTNLWHLAPAIAALVFYLLALTLSYPYLCQVATPVKAPDVVVVDETAGPGMVTPAYDRDQPVSEA
jgi:dihydroorotate dehydrogenase